ncbi:MAG TPA: rhomboid family intramembrane serine protease [Rhodocyclaceae bacterium]|jgi:rhomboid protease GluP
MDIAQANPVAPETESIHTPVTFHTFLARDSRYRGKGEISVNPAQGVITLKGRKMLRLWRSQETFPLDSVHNARIDGKTVYFTLPLARGQWRAVLTCETPEAAARLWNALPEHSNPALYTSQDAQREMEEKLKALSPGTPMTFGLIALNVLVYLVLGNLGVGWDNIKPEALIRWGGNFSALTTDGQWWRLISAMFMHGGIAHLAFNMVALYLFGRTVERIHGALPFLALYLMAGVAGCTATLLTKPAAVGVGASGAIFGLMGLLVAFYMADRSFLSPQSRKSLLINAGIFATYYLMQGLGKAGIDNAAHLGGLLCGLVTGYIVGTPERLKNPGERSSSRLGLALGLAATGTLIGLWAAPDIKPDFQQHQALVEIGNQIGESDKATQADMKNIAARAKSGSISDAEAAGILENQIQRYGQLENRLRGLTPRTQGLRQRHQVFLSYVSRRREAFEILRQAAIANDDSGTERFKAKIEESNAALKTLSGNQSWYP